MLEIKDVYRTYKPKKGVPVKALDGVSLSFADTGLVFILGKSGSGKSTLLNVIGGLDTADSGEFSIKGKSSKDFSQADFDSYRNTFIGFIFQEYNILNEFTVGQNIALAMKLQGKKVDDQSLNAILEEVDLVGYGNRKPNELSGGQKQRVAIARALIKEPEIIMADEPTGALDSNTGKQVFDTLKKLSKSKLVIVVSHDREFAEYYGDRVIELADGKIISDITKETAESRKESEGLSVVDDKILHIRKGYKLTKADMAKIQQYLDNADSDTIISLDERSNESFCQIARIDKDGNQEVFRDTNNEMLSEENKKYDGTSKFIRSKLPFSHAFKIGSSSLKTKPFRLFMTIFLCLISFAMFGLADTIGSYNAKKTTVNSIIDSQYDSAVFTVHQNNDGNYFYDSSGASAKDLDRIKEKTGMDFMGVAYTNSSFSVYESTKLDSGYQYYISQIKGYLPAGNDNFQKYGFDELIGRQPIASDEIVITKYTYEHFALGGLTYYDENEREQVTIKKSEFDSPEKFLSLNPTLALNDYSNGTNKYWKIVGIVDTKTNADGRFDALKPKDNDNSSSSNADSIGSFLLTSEYRKYINYGYHSLGYISENAFKEVVEGQISSTISSVGTKAKGSLSL
ncbi:MAG: ABC transporter ATP-binding protein, partial [Clostridia bacterium]|nr:ABC transporter ATP-binding protein [Clostridia bacterium]